MRQKATRLARTIGGFTLLTVGVAMLPLPGPGLLTILGGLALLASEFAWAQALLDRCKDATTRFRNRLTKNQAQRTD